LPIGIPLEFFCLAVMVVLLLVVGHRDDSFEWMWKEVGNNATDILFGQRPGVWPCSFGLMPPEPTLPPSAIHSPN
jgi:hypothetical protein